MSENRELARQLMLAYRREHGRRELANVLAENGLPSSFTDIGEHHIEAIIATLTPKLNPAAVAHAKRVAFEDTAPNFQEDEDDAETVAAPAARVPAASAPKSFGDIVGPAYSKWNSAKGNRS